MKAIYILFACLTLLSCSKSSSNVSQFQGGWQGTYAGDDDNGTFSVSINASGDASGQVTSTVISQSFQATGNVTTAGTITLTIGTAASGATFIGTLKGTAGSGTWENKLTNPPFTGTWSGHKL